MRVLVEKPEFGRMIERDGLGWRTDAGLWIEGEPGKRRVRRILGRRLKG